MEKQRTIFDHRPEVAKQRAADKDLTRCEQWERFHKGNPEVFAECVRFARIALERGWRNVGFALVWERMRWSRLETNSGSGFKLNNNFQGRFARIVMRQNPDLVGVFSLRRLHFDCEPSCRVCREYGFREDQRAILGVAI